MSALTINSFNVTATVTAAAISASTDRYSEIVLRASPSNTNPVLIGDSTEVVFSLAKDDPPLRLRLGRADRLYAKVAVGTETLHVILLR